MMETTLLDMKAGFPPSPKPIQGIPMLQSLIELLFHLYRCAQTHQSPASTIMNLLFVQHFMMSTLSSPQKHTLMPLRPSRPKYLTCPTTSRVSTTTIAPWYVQRTRKTRRREQTS
jgi:hypothetical protein